MHKASIEIEATPEQVFTFMTDPARIRSWQPDVVEPKPVPPGGLRVGAHVGATVEERGRRFDVDLVVAALTPNQHIAYHMEAPSASARIDYRLIQWGHRTRLVSTTYMRPKGFLGPLYFLLKGNVQRKMESRLRLLRDVMEKTTGSSPTGPRSAWPAAPAAR